LVREYIESADSLLALVDELRKQFEEKEDEPAERYIAFRRHGLASQIVQEVLKSPEADEKTLTDRIDSVLCHRFLGPVCMVLVFYTLYELAVNQGVRLAAEVTPYLSSMQTFLETFLPAEGFIEIPLLTSLGSWFMTSVNALLVYIPQFFILFALVAILEDVGYMPRMAFILDRLFRHFGLHGNSTLPLILGGIYVGGCAVPGVMACKAIPDDRSRMATILTVPLMNCLAKTVFYIMLVEAFFPQHKTVAMLFISSITLLFALPIAKILSLTVLKGRETAPFIMEMPPYHLPTIRGVLTRAVERIWVYLKKVVTIVAAVAVVIWALLQFPGLSPEKQAAFQVQADKAFASFQRQVKKDSLQNELGSMDQVLGLLAFRDAYRSAKAGVGGDRQASKAVDREFKAKNPVFFNVLKDRRSKIHRAFRKLRKTRSRIMREMQHQRVNSSLLGKAGKALEPLSQYAGFDWRVNVAMLSSFAARESATATMKVLYDIGPDGKYKGEMGDGEQTINDLNALALMLFMALFPPCLAATIMVKVATGKYKWMLFSFAYPAFLGMVVASAVYTIGSALNMTGDEAMAWVYALAIGLAVTMGFVKDKNKPEAALGV
jgi:ferrous iron transport protein B